MELASELWCINCGNRGIPVIRARSMRKEKGHRKALYCTTCRMVINHIETRSVEEAEKFREDFVAGRYTEEAEESIQYAKEHGI